jgi:hypothetical protein
MLGDAPRGPRGGADEVRCIILPVTLSLVLLLTRGFFVESREEVISNPAVRIVVWAIRAFEEAAGEVAVHRWWVLQKSGDEVLELNPSLNQRRA